MLTVGWQRYFLSIFTTVIKATSLCLKRSIFFFLRHCVWWNLHLYLVIILLIFWDFLYQIAVGAPPLKLLGVSSLDSPWFPPHETWPHLATVVQFQHGGVYGRPLQTSLPLDYLLCKCGIIAINPKAWPRIKGEKFRVSGAPYDERTTGDVGPYKPFSVGALLRQIWYPDAFSEIIKITLVTAAPATPCRKAGVKINRWQ